MCGILQLNKLSAVLAVALISASAMAQLAPNQETQVVANSCHKLFNLLPRQTRQPTRFKINADEIVYYKPEGNVTPLPFIYRGDADDGTVILESPSTPGELIYGEAKNVVLTRGEWLGIKVGDQVYYGSDDVTVFGLRQDGKFMVGTVLVDLNQTLRAMVSRDELAVKEGLSRLRPGVTVGVRVKYKGQDYKVVAIYPSGNVVLARMHFRFLALWNTMIVNNVNPSELE